MRVRKTDNNNDMTFGQGLSNFWIDAPDGVAQVILSRLMFWQGEWFLDLNDGTPYNTKVLGKYTNDTRDATLSARIAQTEGVNQIISFASQVNRNTRQYSMQATVETVYGVTEVQAGPI